MLRLRKTVGVLCAGLLALTTMVCAADDPFAPIAPAMQKFVDDGTLSGVVTLVANKDKVLYQNAVGTSDLSRKMQTNDLFWIASMGKPMTAVAAAMLVDDGKLKFDDPVEKYLPEFKNFQVAMSELAPVPVKRQILVRDLLNHTSGLPYNYEKTEQHWTLEQYIHQITTQPMVFQPGEDWMYSNAGIDVVGLIVQKASGMPFDQFMQQRLFDALGMKDTTFWIKPQDVKRYAHAYAPDAESHKLKEMPCMGMYGTEITDTQRAPLGAAGIFSTAEDLAKFYQMMLNGGKAAGDKVILKPETVAQMTRNQVGDLDPGNGLSWGYGFCVIADPKKLKSDAMLSQGTFGHVGLYGTNSWADPKRGGGTIYVILLEHASIENYLDSPMRTEFQNLAAKAVDAQAKP